MGGPYLLAQVISNEACDLATVTTRNSNDWELVESVADSRKLQMGEGEQQHVSGEGSPPPSLYLSHPSRNLGGDVPLLGLRRACAQHAGISDIQGEEVGLWYLVLCLQQDDILKEKRRRGDTSAEPAFPLLGCLLAKRTREQAYHKGLPESMHHTSFPTLMGQDVLLVGAVGASQRHKGTLVVPRRRHWQRECRVDAGKQRAQDTLQAARVLVHILWVWLRPLHVIVLE